MWADTPRYGGMIATRIIIALIFCLRPVIGSAQTPPCAPPPPNDSQPWEYKTKLLSSFPWDSPPPRFFGAFRDQAWDYELVLYRDAQGLFGLLHSPILEADSPTSRLYNVRFDSMRGVLKFQARFGYGDLSFSGSLSGRSMRGVVSRENQTKRVVLRRMQHYEFKSSYHSRAQFACEMTLNHW